MPHTGPVHRLPKNVVNYHKLLYGKRKPLYSHTLREGGKGLGKFLHPNQWLGRPGEEDLVRGVSNTLLMAGAEPKKQIVVPLTSSSDNNSKSAVVPFSPVHDTKDANSTISKFLEILGKRDIGHTAPYRVATLFSQSGHILRTDHYNYLMSTAVKNTRSVNKGGENVAGSLTQGPHAPEHSGGSSGWYQALKCYGHMSQMRRVPNIHTWCILMEACRKGALVGASIPSIPSAVLSSRSVEKGSSSGSISTNGGAVEVSDRISLWLHALSIFQQLASPEGSIYGTIPAVGFMSAINSARFSSDWRVALKTFSFGVGSFSQREELTSKRGTYIVTPIPCVTIDAGVISAFIRCICDAGEASGLHGTAWHSALSILTATHCPSSLSATGSGNAKYTNDSIVSPSNAPLASLGAVNAVLRLLNYSKRHDKVIEVCQKIESVIKLSPNQSTLEELHEAHRSYVPETNSPQGEGTDIDSLIENDHVDDSKFPLYSALHPSPSSQQYRFPVENSLFTVFNWSRSLSMPIPENILTDIFVSLFRSGMNKSADALLRSMVLETCQNPGDSNTRLTPLFSAFTTALLTHPDPFVTAPAMLEKHRHRIEAAVALNTSDLGEVGDDNIRWVLPITDRNARYAVAVIDAQTLINRSLEALLTRYNMIIVPCSEVIKALRASGVFTSSNPSTGTTVTPIRSSHSRASWSNSSGGHKPTKGRDVLSYTRESTQEVKAHAGYHLSLLLNGFTTATMFGHDTSLSEASDSSKVHDDNSRIECGYSRRKKNKNPVYESIGEIIASCFIPSKSSKETLRRLVVLPYAHEIYSHRFLVPPDTIRARLAEASLTATGTGASPKLLMNSDSGDSNNNTVTNQNVPCQAITVRGGSSPTISSSISSKASSNTSSVVRVGNEAISDFLSKNSTAASCLAVAKMLKTLNPTHSTLKEFSIGVGTGVEVACIMSDLEDRRTARFWDTKYCTGVQKNRDRALSNNVVENQVAYATPSGIRLNSLTAEVEYIAQTEELAALNKKNVRLEKSK